MLENSAILVEKNPLHVSKKELETRSKSDLILLFQDHQKGYQNQLTEIEIHHNRIVNNIVNEMKAEHQAKIDKLEAQYNQVVAELLAVKRAQYGKKSERFVMDDDAIGMTQQPLFETKEETESNDTPKPEDLETITYKRKKRRPKQAPNDVDAIPKREVIIPVSDEERKCGCGCQKDVIGYDERSRLHFIPAQLELLIEKREKVACRKGCDGSIATAKAPKTLLPKVKATEDLLSYIAVAKCLDRNPLYHIERKIAREHQWHIPRQTMARWLIQLADPLQQLVNLLIDTVQGYDIAYVDATSLQVLKEPQRPAETKSHVFCIRGGPPDKHVTLLDYTAYHNQDYIETLFADYKGLIHSDAHQVYNVLHDKPDIQMSYCHAHARRKFEQVYQSSRKKDGLAKQALKTYRALYDIEAYAKDEGLTPTQRKALRDAKSRPILDDHYEWLNQNQSQVFPKSPIGKAIAYSLNHWSHLLTFLKDGRLEIDNNETERTIKYFVMARKNFLFSATPQGADSLGVHFSLLLTAQEHGLDPFAYYTHILKKLPYATSFTELDRLLPWNVKQNS